MQVDDVASPATGINRVEELTQESASIAHVVATIPRGRRAEAHARGHEILPVVQNLLEGLRMVIGRVARLVVGLHVGRIGGLSAGGCRRPVLIDMMGHALGIGSAVLAQSEGVARGHVERRDCGGPRVVGHSGLSRVVPLEDAIRRDTAVEDGRQFLHLQVLVGCNEATAVAPSGGFVGKGHHIATLQFEGADAVVQRTVVQRLHESALMARSVGVA